MTDYISVDVLLSAAKDYNWISGLKTVLKRIPIADVRPVVRAHWIETAPINEETMKPFIVKGPHLKCSNCGSIEFQRNYCPNCGAKMDGGVNDAAD